MGLPSATVSVLTAATSEMAQEGTYLGQKHREGHVQTGVQGKASAFQSFCLTQQLNRLYL